MEQKDLRIKIVNELLSGIKVIKMYAWEIPFMGKVNEARVKELATLKSQGYLMSIVGFTWFLAPYMASSACCLKRNEYNLITKGICLLL